MNEATVKMSIRAKYDYLNTKDIELLYNTAESIYLDKRYPFARDIVRIPDTDPRAYQWILRCVDELVEKSNCMNAKQYSENGLTVIYDNAGLSKQLLNQVIPKVGTI